MEAGKTNPNLMPLPLMKSLDESMKRPAEEEADTSEGVKKARVSTENRKIYIGNLPPSVTEKPLVAHFRPFGHVIDCHVIRDKESGISRGFAFLTFLDESEAETAVEYQNHTLDGKPIRVSWAQGGGGHSSLAQSKKGSSWQNLETIVLPRDQTRLYLGPLDPDVTSGDIVAQFEQFGMIKGVSKLNFSKKSFAFVEFKDSISVRRAFSNKIFIKGKHVKITMSKLAMELVLSKSVVFFYEAHEHCDRKTLEQHFKQFGQVFRTLQLLHDDMQTPKPYGFVDFLGEDSVQRSMNVKQQLVKDQFIRVSKFLPSHLLQDLFVMGDKHGNALIRKMEQSVPDQGSWGDLIKDSENITSQVRIPAKMVAKVIGERGKTITEICRDSKTKISIPRVQGDETNVVISITGTKMNIRTAQYIMQKLLKPK